MRKIICLILLALVLTGFAGAYAYELREEDQGFTLIAESETKALLMDEKTMEIRFVDIKTGKTWDTAEMNGQMGNRTIKALQKAALQATFIVNAQNATTNTMDSYSKSIETNTFSWEKIDNGVEITYTIGDDAYIIDDLPKGIRADKYMKLVESTNWTSGEKKDFNANYRAVKPSGLDQEYMIRAKDDGMSALLIKKLYGMIFSSGVYTQEDMIEDNAAVNYVREYSPEVSFTVRYELDGDDLLFSILCDKITYTPDNEPVSVSAMPYFLTADNTQQGYIFVPDGSGALIDLNNGKLSATAYSMPVYGSDALVNASKYVSDRTNVALPLFGIKKSDSAMIAIIEEGAEIATINATISGRSDEFNRVHADFVLRNIENVSLAGNESVTSPRYAEDVYQGNITLRYKWLTDENADYLDMAKTYREYLIENGVLTENEKDENAPFFMEVLGAVNKDKFILGIPYQSSVQATTIKEAGLIYDEVKKAGIANVKMIYSGLFEGGIKNSSLSKLELDSGIGSEKELTALSKKLSDAGDRLYPGVYWSRVYTDRAFSPLKEAARKHDGDPAYVYTFGEPILKHSKTNHQGYYISPYYLGEYTDEALKNLSSLKFEGISIFDMGNTLVGDHKRKANMSRIHATERYEEALEKVTGTYDLMLDQPLLYALPYADAATNLPDSDNGFAITDKSIPFMQWVLDGSMPYSSESWNSLSFMGYEYQLLWALESLSCPRFTFSWENPNIYANTEDVDYMAYYSSQYESSLDDAAELYKEFNEFYRMVSTSSVKAHEIINAKVRRVTYENGVSICLNYGTSDYTLDGTVIPAEGYAIGKGGF